jgi:hypothetical protein
LDIIIIIIIIHGLRAFEKKELKGYLHVREVKQLGDGLYNGEIHSLYYSPNIIRMTKSRRMGGAGHVIRFRKVINMEVYGKCEEFS